jgi:hypothetical protein
VDCEVPGHGTLAREYLCHSLRNINGLRGGAAKLL